MTAFAQFTAALHEKGVCHEDYSPGNVLIAQIDGQYHFSLVDINRMTFKPMNLEEGCKNFRRMFISDELYIFLAKKYAQCRNFDQDNVPAKSEWGNKITRQVLKYLCGVAVSDTQTGLRGIPAAFMRHLMNVKGERFEFETYMLLEAGEQKVGIREVPIETVYLNDNKGSHFNPLLDSARIYLVFAKFLFSSLSSCIIDLVLFALFCSLTKERIPETVSYIVVSTVLARVVSAGYNFFLNYRVVFKSSGAVWKSAVRYFVLAVVQMLASAGLVSLLYGVLGGSEVAVKILVDVFLFFISFLIQREIVYR